MTSTEELGSQALEARVIYIAGNGRSGSTLLDLAIGDNPGAFSAGELTFVAREGLQTESCGCGKPIGDCALWREVFEKWRKMQPVDVAEYGELRHRYELNRTVPRLLWNLLWPSTGFRRYCEATKALYVAIQQVTGATTIVDSSKTPGRIPIVAKLADVTVVHLCRDFSGYLNSLSKSMQKDVRQGLEVDLHPIAPGKALFLWLSNNLLVQLFSLGKSRRRVHYVDMVTEADATLRSIDPNYGYQPGHAFARNHMLAGNKLRVKQEISINPNLGFDLRELTPATRKFAKIIDRAFWFWAKR